LKHNDISIKTYKAAHQELAQDFSQVSGLGQEYEQLYKKYHIDSVMSGPESSHDFSNMLELYLSIFCRHIYFDPSITRDIHIVTEES
jgi:hypothetical protein